MAAALFLSALTIRPCLALFNVRHNNILRSGRPMARFQPRPSASDLSFEYLRGLGGERFRKLRHYRKIDWVSFPSPAVYNRPFPNTFHNRSPALTDINLPTDFNTNLLMLFRWLPAQGRQAIIQYLGSSIW